MPAPELVTKTCASSLWKLWMVAVPSAVSNVADGHSPYHVLLLKDKENCTLSAPPPRMTYPACCLAIMDFTATTLHPWSTSAVASLVKAVHSIYSSTWLQFIFLLSPADGVTMASVLDFIFKLSESNPYDMERDHGSYWPHRLPVTTSPIHSFLPVMILRAFVSTKREAWSTIMKGQTEYYFGYNPDVDIDIVPHFDMATIQRSLEEDNAAQVLQGGREKTPKQIWHDILALYLPHHTMCGLTASTRSATLFPNRVATQLIVQNSDPKEIVIDCFSGGWVSKTALLNGRECAAYTTSKMEFDFLETYLPLLKGIDSAKDIFKSAGEGGAKPALRVASTSTSFSTRALVSRSAAPPRPSTSGATTSTTSKSTNTRLSKMTAAEANNKGASAKMPRKSLQIEEQAEMGKTDLVDIPRLETTSPDGVNTSDNDSNSSMSSGVVVPDSKTKAAELNVDKLTYPTYSARVTEFKPDDNMAHSDHVSPIGSDLVPVSEPHVGSANDMAATDLALMVLAADGFAPQNLAMELGTEDLVAEGVLNVEGIQGEDLQATIGLSSDLTLSVPAGEGSACQENGANF